MSTAPKPLAGNAASTDERHCTMGGEPANQVISFIEIMDDDAAAVVDELAMLDGAPEVAKLTV